MQERNPHFGTKRHNGAAVIPAARWRQWAHSLCEHPLSKKLAVFAPIFLLVLAPFIWAILFIPKTYYSGGTIIIGDLEPNAGAASPAWVQKLGDPADLESQLIIIRSRR